MANDKTSVYHTTGVTVYFQIRDMDAQVWNGSAFETYSTVNIANYDIAMTEQGTASGVYVGTIPALAEGTYRLDAFQQAGGSPAETDTHIGEGFIEWDGSSIASLPERTMALTANDNAENFWAALRSLTISSVTVNGDSTVTLGTDLNLTANAYIDSVMTIYSGSQVGKSARILSHDGVGNYTFASDAWQTNPVATDKAFILGLVD